MYPRISGPFQHNVASWLATANILIIHYPTRHSFAPYAESDAITLPEIPLGVVILPVILYELTRAIPRPVAQAQIWLMVQSHLSAGSDFTKAITTVDGLIAAGLKRDFGVFTTFGTGHWEHLSRCAVAIPITAVAITL